MQKKGESYSREGHDEQAVGGIKVAVGWKV
jgi:hypothetical protein